MRKYEVGTKVLVRRGKVKKFEWLGKVVQVISPTSYRIKFPSGLESTHNQFNMKRLNGPTHFSDQKAGLAAYDYVAYRPPAELSHESPVHKADETRSLKSTHNYNLRPLRSRVF